MNIQDSNLNLRKEVLSGTIWSIGGQFAAAGLRFGNMLVLARMLSPEFFGLLGMSLVVMLILRDVSDMGLSAALVQRAQIDETDLATIFWFNLAVSLLMAGLLFAGAGFLAKLLGDVRLEPILRALALLLPTNALALVPRAMLLRDLKFAQLAWQDVAGMVGFGLVGIPMATLGMGVWSLIGALAAQWISRSALVWLVSPYRVTFQFKWNRLRRLSGFSIWMFSNLLLGRLIDNADYFLIGRYLGAAALGHYTLAFQLVITPVRRIAGILTAVLFPSFAKIQNQLLRLQRGFLQALKMLAWVLFPLSAFLFVVADILVPALYSDRWLPAVPVVRILALTSFFYGLSIVNPLLNAIGKPNWRFVILSFQAAIFILFAWGWGLARGIEGVAWSIMAAVAVSIVLQIWVLRLELQITLLALARTFYMPLLALLPTGVLTWWLKNILSIQSDALYTVLLAVVFGTVYTLITLPGYYNSLVSAK